MTGRPRVALVTAVDVDAGHGGAPMRVRALHSALAASTEVRLLRTRCTHDGFCPDRRAGAADPFAGYFCARTLERLRAELAGWPLDVVVVTELQLHRYALEFARRADVPVVLDLHNVEFPLRRAIGERAPAGSWPALNFTSQHCAAVRQVEHHALRAVDQVWACSQTDKDTALAWYPDVPADKIQVVPNAVPMPAGGPVAGPPARVVFTGRLDYYPNIEAVQLLGAEVVPRLRLRRPGLPVVVAGAAATEETHLQAARGAIVLVEDPAETASLIRGSVMAIPLRAGGGSRFKILEALAVGSPVVSTAKGAEGLDVVPGTHFLAAESMADFADAIATVTTDWRLRADLGRAGCDLVRRQYSVEAISRTVARHLGLLGKPATP
jgi:polysaccharide biosynthesis protein PslH